jgi:hypothetical protein
MRRLLCAALALAVLLAGMPVTAAELQERTSRAYAAYLEQARQAFLSRVRRGAAVPATREGVLSAGPGRDDGIIGLDGGLVHHWMGAAFVRGISLREALAVASDYDAYSAFYKSIIGSKVLGRDNGTYRVLMRLKEGEAGITAVLDVRSLVEYHHPSDRVVYAISSSDEIREVKNPGRRDERLLPPGRDSGYLWRANTFSYFVESDAGVYLEMETLGLSRRFPPLLGWIIEPIARRIGRRSVERSLEEFLAAIRGSAQKAGQGG